MAQTIYTIPASNMPGLMYKLARLSRKSVKINGTEIGLQILEEIRTPRVRWTEDGRRLAVRDLDGNTVFDISYSVTINAEAPRIHGWTFLATIDHSSESGNIVRLNPNVDYTVPERFRTVEPRCEHCNKIRSRKDTFLLRCDANGDVKQIGRTCIADFIGNDIGQVLAMAEIISKALPSNSDADEDWSAMTGRDERYIYVRTFLAHASVVIRKFGWVSKQKAEAEFIQSSAAAAHENMYRRPSDKYKPQEITDKDLAIVDAALAYGASLAGRTSEYEHNLSVVARDTFIAHRSVGILTSLIPNYQRSVQQAFERSQANTDLALDKSRYVGKVNDTLEPAPATLYAYKTFSGKFGPVHQYSFFTDGGNVVLWYASKDVADNLDMGQVEATNRLRVMIGGKVKKHGEFQGVKQTTLTYCKVSRMETEAA